ncbi:hypothetical protein ACE38V_17240 [Cytobacillus sp. Hz8]|uniref:hypothetical protein n=1 Tax=Cytobacillus sp. Hz8 TaxID=3347168 RepID=UPI0035DC9DC9
MNNTKSDEKIQKDENAAAIEKELNAERALKEEMKADRADGLRNEANSEAKVRIQDQSSKGVEASGTNKVKNKKVNKPQCMICKSNGSLIQIQSKWLCENCLHIGNEKLALPWKASLETLFKEYSEHCYRYISEDTEDVEPARVLGHKIRTALKFLGVSKNSEILLSIKRINRLFNNIHETDEFLNKTNQDGDEKNLYLAMAPFLSKKRKKQRKEISLKVPSILNEQYHHKVELFLERELVPYVVQLKKIDRLNEYEDRFNQLVQDYQQTVEEVEKTSEGAIKLLYSIQKKSKSLRDLYDFLNGTIGDHFENEEDYHKKILHQIHEINKVEIWISQLKINKHKIHAPKGDIKKVRKDLKERLENLIGNVEVSEVALSQN